MFVMNYHFYFLLKRLKGNKKAFLQVVAFKVRAIKCLRAVAQHFESLRVVLGLEHSRGLRVSGVKLNVCDQQKKVLNLSKLLFC